jgi:CrcB protein
MMWLMVALGGAAGSLLRYAVGRLAIAYLGPSTVLGTFLVNVTGSFVLGLLITLALERAPVALNSRLLLLIGVGLLGSYTTFSTFSVESIRLIESGYMVRAGLSILGNVALSLGAAYLGILLGRAI